MSEITKNTKDIKKPLPPGWRWVKLGEVCVIIAGQSPPGHTYRKKPEGLPFFQGKLDFGDRNPVAQVWCIEPTKIALPGDILISVRAPVGPTNLADQRCCIGRGLAAIRCGANVDREFLLSWLKLVQAVIAKTGSGSTFSAINRKNLEDIRLPLPPLAEQNRIVAILNQQMAAVERARADAEAQLEGAKALPAAFLRQVFPRPGQALPPGWRWMKLGEVCEFLDNRRKPINENERNARIAGKSASDLFPYYGANGQVGWIDGYLFDEPLILLAEDGGFFGSANKPIAYKVSGRYWVNNHAHVLRPKADIDFEYLYHSLAIRPDVGDLVTGNTRPKLNQEIAATIPIPLPSLAEQKRIAGMVNEQMAAVERARAAAEAQLAHANSLPSAYLRESMKSRNNSKMRAGDCLVEVKEGVGAAWKDLPVLGATRDGIAPAKEPVGKKPERYKLVDEGTVFYNPMRILIGSIAVVDEGDTVGITSPDYVVLKTRLGILHYRWFYYWLRSHYGQEFIRSLARGAVRERMLFRRLASGVINIPDWPTQLRTARLLGGIRPLIEGIEAQLDEINAVPAALLRRAFDGEL